MFGRPHTKIQVFIFSYSSLQEFKSLIFLVNFGYVDLTSQVAPQTNPKLFKSKFLSKFQLIYHKEKITRYN